MASFDTVAYSVIMREVVEPEIKKYRDESAMLYNLIENGQTREVTARGVKILFEGGVNPSMRWFEEGGVYAKGGAPSFADMLITYARFNITGRLTRDVLEHKGVREMANILTDFVTRDTVTATKEFNQQCYEDGSGRKAVVSTRDSGTQLTLAAPFGASRLLKGGVYNIYAGTARGSYSVGDKVGTTASTLASKVNTSGVAVFDSTIHADVVAGDILTYEDSYGRAIHGLDYIISNGTGTFQNQSRSTYPELRSYVEDAAGGNLTVARLDKMVFQAKYLRGKVKGEDVNRMVMISSPAQVHRYAGLGALSSSGLTSVPDSKILDLGYTAYKYAGMTWIEDVDCPDNVLYFVNLNLIKRYVLKELSPVPLTGNEYGLAPIPAFDSNGNGSYRDSAMYALTAKMDLGSPDPQAAGMKLTNLGTSGVASRMF